MTTHKDPSPEALANLTEENVHARARLLPEETSVDDGGAVGGTLDPEVQAAAILAESEERTEHADPDDAQGGHRRSEDTV
ncbi:hypothetical protein GB931_06590 [Modestobacter sp. I12A-02628]|uniref:Uncharacterized protein n=1 Tax=Goekera deserti TaxID=2497753 RepID=A0A7K3WDH0_9ACTN|nr:hypothetical protein [Goekera deserti]MPQ97591.1 hypothetical protein [Goekera deserti]NDI47805.1 hypothetical protein [Goekera deserti]NEL53553.1 hypothetical protein [Goekera deserti]